MADRGPDGRWLCGRAKTGGRQKGVANVRTRELLDRAAARGIMPLDVMLEHMRSLYDKGDLAGAHMAARDAAPYLHPRLAAADKSVALRPATGPDEAESKRLAIAAFVEAFGPRSGNVVPLPAKLAETVEHEPITELSEVSDPVIEPAVIEDEDDPDPAA